MNKKGQLGLSQLPSAVLLLGLAAVIGIIVAVLVANVGSSDSVTAGSYAANISTDSQAGIGAVFDNFSLIGLMIGLGIVLLVLVGVFVALRRTGAF